MSTKENLNTKVTDHNNNLITLFLFVIIMLNSTYINYVGVFIQII